MYESLTLFLQSCTMLWISKVRYLGSISVNKLQERNILEFCRGGGTLAFYFPQEGKDNSRRNRPNQGPQLAENHDDGDYTRISEHIRKESYV